MALEHVETAQLRPKKRKARWNIEARLRDALMVRAVMILADKETSHNAVCKASALLVRAEAQNQKDEQRKKKRAPKKDIPVVRRGWDEQEAEDKGQRPEVGDQLSTSSGQGKSEDKGQENVNAECGSKAEESGVRNQESETKSQEAGEAMSSGTAEASSASRRRKRARRWNIKPEYRDLMVLRWSRIVADPKASQTVLFAVGALMMRAEVQNQKDEEYRRKNKHRYPKQIVVEFTRDFYNNNAHELAAARAAAEAKANPAAEANSESVVAGAKEDRDLRPEASGSKGTTVFATAGTKEKHDLRPEVKPDAGKASGLGPQSWYATGPPGRRD